MPSILKEPKGELDAKEVRELKQVSYTTFNYPLAASGRSIPVPAHVLYLLCRDWLKGKEKN